MFAMLVTLAGGSRHPGDASLANFILQMADEVFTTLENISRPFPGFLGVPSSGLGHY